jgi:acetylornithine deacetylase/succinyl-diaminopimelate desuccinylase-like protein
MDSCSDILSGLIRIPSVNPMGGAVDSDICFEHRVSDWLDTFFDSIGADHQRIEAAAGRDNIIARYDAGPSKPTILLDAHQDTVPVSGMADPFDPQFRDGRIYGRGACDVKGGLAAMLFAFRRLFRERPENSANVVMSCSCDEEANMSGVRQLVSNWQSSPPTSTLLSTQPDVCVVAEPTELDVVVAHLGVLRFRVRTQGKACHASDPSQGKNAIYAMAPIIQWLEDHAKSLSTNTQTHPLCGPRTLSVGMIHGGTSVNIVPAECAIEIDRRLIPGEDPIKVWESFKSDLTRFPDVICEPPFLAAPSLGDLENDFLADRLSKSIGELNIEESSQVGVSYCTNASTIEKAGVPSVVFGPGSIAQAHTADEHVEVDQLDTAAEVYFRFCSTYGSETDGSK